MNNEAPVSSSPRWNTVVLVCKDCRKRSKGPRHLKPKAVMATLRGDAKRDGRVQRIVATGCLGLCPRNALAVAIVGRDVATRLFAIGSCAQLEAAVPLLRAASVPGETGPAALAFPDPAS